MVAKQEMLHLAINCNLVSSLGASPHLSRPNLPQPAKHYPPGVILTLLPFGEEALRHFIYLERPEGMDFDDAEGLAAFEGAAPMMGPEEIAPHLQEFATVGHLYRKIEAGFRHLGEKLGGTTSSWRPPLDRSAATCSAGPSSSPSPAWTPRCEPSRPSSSRGRGPGATGVAPTSAASSRSLTSTWP